MVRAAQVRPIRWHEVAVTETTRFFPEAVEDAQGLSEPTLSEAWAILGLMPSSRMAWLARALVAAELRRRAHQPSRGTR